MQYAGAMQLWHNLIMLEAGTADLEEHVGCQQQSHGSTRRHTQRKQGQLDPALSFHQQLDDLANLQELTRPRQLVTSKRTAYMKLAQQRELDIVPMLMFMTRVVQLNGSAKLLGTHKGCSCAVNLDICRVLAAKCWV